MNEVILRLASCTTTLSAATLALSIDACHRAPDAVPTPPDKPSATAVVASAPPPLSAAPTDPVPAGDAAGDGAFDATEAGLASAGDASAEAGDAGDGPRCPGEMAQVSRTCVDKWEAHLVSRAADGVEVTHPHYERPEAGVAYEARSAAGLFPQGYISRVEAAAACKNAGKRLCTRSEWTRACTGRRGWTYPYGNGRRAGKCNQGKLHLLSKMFGTNGRAWKYDEHFNSPLLLQEPGFLAKTGEYAECTGDAGVWDMIGNLHEWVKDTVTEDLVTGMESDGVERRKQPWREGNGIFMGGFFSTGSEHGPGCKFTTIAHEPTYHDYSIGFRCCLSLPREEKPKRRGPR